MSTAHPPPTAGSNTTTTTATATRRPSWTPSPTSSVDSTSTSAMMTTTKKGRCEKSYPRRPSGAGNGNANNLNYLHDAQVPPKNTNSDDRKTRTAEAKVPLEEIGSQTKRVSSETQHQQQQQLFSKSTSEVSMTSSSDASHSEPSWELTTDANANPTFPSLSSNHNNGNGNAQILQKRPFHTEPDPIGVPDNNNKVMQDNLATINQESTKVDLTRSVPAIMSGYVQQLVPIAPAPAAPAQEQSQVQPLPALTPPDLAMQQYAPIMPKPAKKPATATTTAAAMVLVPDCLSRQEGAYLQIMAASQPLVLPILDHTNHNNKKPPDLTASSPSSYPLLVTCSSSIQSAATPSQAGGYVLQKPVFPTSLAPPTVPTATEAKDSPETTTQMNSSTTSLLRNQTMQATADCLLLAASLLQETIPPVPSKDKEEHGTNRRPSSASSNSSRHHPSPPAATTPKLPLPPALFTSRHHAMYTHSQEEPRELDVLCGRGGLINKHVGNIIYRRVVEHNKSFYQSVPKRHRILVSQSIVHTILRRGGRFLSEDTKTTRGEDGTTSTVILWKTVATARAIQKTSQALRERVAAVKRSTEAEVTVDNRCSPFTA